MRKYLLFLGLIAFTLAGCEEENGNGTNNQDETAGSDFEQVLLSKDWTVTEYKDDFVGNWKDGEKCWELSSTLPDPCGFGEICDAAYLWKTYTADFTSSDFTGTFIFDKTVVDSINTDDCMLDYATSTETEVYTGSWTFNEGDNTLAVNFGNIFDFAEGDFVDTFTNLAYTVESYNESRIELKSTITVDQNSITREITLE